MQGVSKRALHLLKLMYIYSEDMHSVLNCHIIIIIYFVPEIYIWQYSLQVIM
jgi:hypothetical protein